MRFKIIGGVLAALVLQPAPAAAFAPPPAAAFKPRNDLGQPNLEGMWAANFLMRFEAASDAPGLVVPEPQARTLAAARVKKAQDMFTRGLDPETPGLLAQVDGLPLVRGERRTRLVVQPADGKLPFTPEGRKEYESDGPPETFDNVEDRPSAERCLVGQGQPPLTSFIFTSPLQILQTRDYVVLHTEYGDEVRAAPFAAAHRPVLSNDRLGDSIARWEGETLVIETVGMPDADRTRFWPVLIVGGGATVVERFTRVSAKELLYQFTVIDSKIYAAPWQGEFSFYATGKPIYEHACHEGNYALAGILSGARHDEAVAAEKAAGKSASSR